MLINHNHSWADLIHHNPYGMDPVMVHNFWNNSLLGNYRISMKLSWQKLPSDGKKLLVAIIIWAQNLSNGQIPQGLQFLLFLQTKASLVSERCPHRFDGQPYLGIWAVTKMFRTSRFRDTPGFPGFVPQGFLHFRFSIWIKAAATLHMALPDYQTLQCIIAINYTALQYHYISLHWFWICSIDVLCVE